VLSKVRHNREVPAESAGLLLYRLRDGKPEVLLVHPGGPFWKRRDAGAWSIPKGEIEDREAAVDVARREFKEELGQDAPSGELVPIGSVHQAGGKVVHAWTVPGDLDVGRIASITFTMEWPPRSGKLQEFPEVDMAEWFGIDAAREKMLPAQTVFLDRLAEMLRNAGAR
jgi:predicted NUDIX family NTP pyrophosphohydrolase